MKAILLARVSTKEQGKSKLGLSSQIEYMRAFCATHNIEILDVMEEVVSGAKELEDRPVLQSAMKVAKQNKGSFILTYKLDRLSRSMWMISSLMRKGIQFRTVELGLDADNFQIYLYGALAEKERELISQRTKSALQQLKLSNPDIRLGSNNENNAKALKVSRQKQASNARDYAESIRSDVEESIRIGMSSRRKIALFLNNCEIPTSRGNKWSAKSVHNLLKILEINP